MLAPAPLVQLYKETTHGLLPFQPEVGHDPPSKGIFEV
jgi:hypothetical protein